MSRLERLPEDSLVNRIAKLRRDFDELKATSHSMGSTGVTMQRVVTGNAVDFHVTATYNIINAWEMNFTPNTEGVPGTGYLWRGFFNGFNATGTGSQVTTIEFVGVTGTSWTYRLYVIGATPSATLNYDVIVILYAMSKGTISVSQII